MNCKLPDSHFNGVDFDSGSLFDSLILFVDVVLRKIYVYERREMDLVCSMLNKITSQTREGCIPFRAYDALLHLRMLGACLQVCTSSPNGGRALSEVRGHKFLDCWDPVLFAPESWTSSLSIACIHWEFGFSVAGP